MSEPPPTGAPGPDELAAGEESLSAEEVRRRALVGAALLGLRGMGIRAIGLAGTVVLARLLLPSDYGIVSFGLTLTASITFLAESGIGAGLIRRREPPDREDLATVVAFQLMATAACALVVAAAALPFGRGGQVTALMVAALPIAALRTPGTVVLERALSYRTVVAVELLEVLAFFGWAAFAVGVLDAGVWGVASAQVLRSFVGSALMVGAGPVGLVRPRLDRERLRSLLGFGLRYQAIGGLSVLRDQGLNLGTLAIAGTGVLGLWALAYRVLQVPFLLFESLFRVSYPAMSQLMGRGEEPRPILERGLGIAAVGTVALLAPLVGSAPALIPALVGQEWREAVDVVPWASAALAVGGPVTVVSAGYLYAVGDAQTVLRGAACHTVVWIAVALALLEPVGVAALGIGWLVGGLLDVWVLARRVRARTGAAIVAPLAVPVAAGAAAGAAGWALSASLPETIPAALAGAGLAGAVVLAALGIARRETLREAVAAVHGAVAAGR